MDVATFQLQQIRRIGKSVEPPCCGEPLCCVYIGHPRFQTVIRSYDLAAYVKAFWIRGDGVPNPVSAVHQHSYKCRNMPIG